MPSFRLRKLERVEEEVSDLLRDLHHETQFCLQCGAYHAADLPVQEVHRELLTLLQKVRRWKEQAWAREVAEALVPEEETDKNGID